MAKFSTRSSEALKGVHPNLVKVMNEAIKSTPIDFTIVEGVRTTKRQQELYAQGRTTKGYKVTNADGVKNKSNHQAKSDGFGHAVDLYPYINGAIDFNDQANRLSVIADHILNTAKRLNIGITWGGNFKSILDRPHFELK